MSEYEALSFNLEIMLGPDGAEAELYDAHDAISMPIIVTRGATADEAVAKIVAAISFDPHSIKE